MLLASSGTQEDATTATTTVQCDFCQECTKMESDGPCVRRSSITSPTHIPYVTLPGGMTILQCDAIMSLVSIAENSTTSWWENYAYCENIHDGRGMTVSLVGFCSGTGDLLWVFRDLQKLKSDHPLLSYLPALVKVNGTAKTTGLTNLAKDIKAHDDQYWRQAVWDGILHFYWNAAIKYVQSLGLNYPISKGFLYDIALNHGAEQLPVMGKQVTAKAPNAGGDEKNFLAELIAVRQNIITKVDPSTNNGQPDRCIMWNSVLKSGNVNLDRPIKNLVCYGDTFTIN